MKIVLKGFDDTKQRDAERGIRRALGKPNGNLEVVPGILMPNERGFVVVIDGSDEELGDGTNKSDMVNTVFEEVAALASQNEAVSCKMAKGAISRSRNTF